MQTRKILVCLINMLRVLGFFPFRNKSKRSVKKHKIKMYFSYNLFLYSITIIWFLVLSIPSEKQIQYEKVKDNYGNTQSISVVLLNFGSYSTLIGLSISALLNSKRLSQLIFILNRSQLEEQIRFGNKDKLVITILSIFSIRLLYKFVNLKIGELFLAIVDIYHSFSNITFIFLFYFLSLIEKNMWNFASREIIFIQFLKKQNFRMKSNKRKIKTIYLKENTSGKFTNNLESLQDEEIPKKNY